MTVHLELAGASPPGDTVLTVGTFDGVHLGHQKLLRRLSEKASARGLVSAVVTFRNHPRNFLRPQEPVRYITTLEERIALLKGLGLEVVVAVDFTEELSQLRAAEFVGLLCRYLKMKGIVVGPDFALGHKREGNVAELERLGSGMGFWVETVDAALAGDRAVKSSTVRTALARGDVEEAGGLLGRRYALSGAVVEGERRGRLLGFPTANLKLQACMVLPTDGIYATWALAAGRRYQSATCVGVRPTFGGSERTVEAHIMDFDGDLYGERLTLEFAGRLRDEQAFPTVEALVDQMRDDVVRARALLSQEGTAPSG